MSYKSRYKTIKQGWIDRGFWSLVIAILVWLLLGLALQNVRADDLHCQKGTYAASDWFNNEFTLSGTTWKESKYAAYMCSVSIQGTSILAMDAKYLDLYVAYNDVRFPKPGDQIKYIAYKDRMNTIVQIRTLEEQGYPFPDYEDNPFWYAQYYVLPAGFTQEVAVPTFVINDDYFIVLNDGKIAILENTH